MDIKRVLPFDFEKLSKFKVICYGVHQACVLKSISFFFSDFSFSIIKLEKCKRQISRQSKSCRISFSLFQNYPFEFDDVRVILLNELSGPVSVIRITRKVFFVSLGQFFSLFNISGGKSNQIMGILWIKVYDFCVIVFVMICKLPSISKQKEAIRSTMIKSVFGHVLKLWFLTVAAFL